MEGPDMQDQQDAIIDIDAVLSIGKGATSCEVNLARLTEACAVLLLRAGMDGSEKSNHAITAALFNPRHKGLVSIQPVLANFKAEMLERIDRRSNKEEPKHEGGPVPF